MRFRARNGEAPYASLDVSRPPCYTGRQEGAARAPTSEGEREYGYHTATGSGCSTHLYGAVWRRRYGR